MTNAVLLPCGLCPGFILAIFGGFGNAADVVAVAFDMRELFGIILFTLFCWRGRAVIEILGVCDTLFVFAAAAAAAAATEAF